MFMDLKQSDYSSDNNATALLYLNDNKIIPSWLSLYRLSLCNVDCEQLIWKLA